MTTEHARAPWRAPERAILGEAELGAVPAPAVTDGVAELLMEVAANLEPGKALELGCGAGHDVLWLARRGWTVTAVDPSAEAIDLAAHAAIAARVRPVLHVAELADWRPASRFDLVVATFSLPARGLGRSRMLETAARAVAPGGTIILEELDMALFRSGRMAEKHLVSLDELERHLDGFRFSRSATRLVRQRHGFEDIVVPVAQVVATRRTDLRTF